MIRLNLLVLILISVTGCSKVISQRTDEQAWLEFDQEFRSGRKPSSLSDSKATLELRQKLSELPFRSLYLRCFGTASAEACYRSELTMQFDEVFRGMQLSKAELKNNDYRIEQISFLTNYSFQNLSLEVIRFQQSIFSGIELKARSRAAALFKKCDSEKESEFRIESFNVFSSLKYPIPKRVYACLSQFWISDQDQLLKETSERLGLKIVSAEAKLWIKERQMAPLYESEISEMVLKKQKDELAQFDSEKAELLKELDKSQSLEVTVKTWSEILRTKFPYSPVEQWVMKERQK
jgi:hypothetical protein